MDIRWALPQHAAVAEPFVLDELVERLTRTTRLSEREARHLVGEVVAFLDEPVERFARRRHGELQREGFSNTDIYQRIAGEIGQRPFGIGPLTLRQVRRLIYG
jgi:hypothetical protein